MIHETGFPCGYCGVRSDVSCKHRAGSEPRPRFVDVPDGRKTRDYSGMGYNFHRPASSKPPKKLDEMQRAWLKATPLKDALPSGEIVKLACVGSGAMFGHWAQRHQHLFERVRHGNNSYGYRLSEEGAELRAKLDAS